MIEKTCDVQGHTFELTFEPGAAGMRSRVIPLEPVDRVLATVLETGLAASPERLLQWAEQRAGHDWEGEVGFAFPQGDDDGIREGFVSCYSGDSSVEITQELFQQAVLQMVDLHREAAAQLGIG